MNIFSPNQTIKSSELNSNFTELNGASTSGGAWNSWTPTFTNLSGGTLNFAKYIQIGKTIFFRVKYTMTGANVSGSVSFLLPVTGHSDELPSTGYNQIGAVALLDAGVSNYFGFLSTTGSVASILILGTGGAYGTPAAISSTIPFTWNAGDIIFARGSYEAA